MTTRGRRAPGRLERFAALSPAERRLWLEAWWTLLLADLRLRSRSRRSLARAVAAVAAGEPSDPVIRVPESIPRAVDSAAAHHLWAMPCLPRALALWSMLRRRGLEARVRIGVHRAGATLAAHAWVECHGEPVGEARELERRFLALLEPDPGDRS